MPVPAFRNYESELSAFAARLSEPHLYEETADLLRTVFMDPSFVSAELDRQRELGLIEAQESAGDEETQDEPGDPSASASDFSMESNDRLAMKGLEFLRGPDSVLSNYVKVNFPLLPQEGVAAFVDFLTTREMLSEAGFHIGMMDLIRAEVRHNCFFSKHIALFPICFVGEF